MTLSLSHPLRRGLFRRRCDTRAGRRGAGRARARARAQGRRALYRRLFRWRHDLAPLAGTGLSGLAKTFAGVFVAIKFAGAAYLLYLAWRMATAPAVVGAEPTGPRAAGARFLARCR